MFCQIRQYRLAIWSIRVGDLANTGEGTFSKIWEGLRSKSGILKTELWLDMGSRIIKNLQKVPSDLINLHNEPGYRPSQYLIAGLREQRAEVGWEEREGQLSQKLLQQAGHVQDRGGRAQVNQVLLSRL